jgi:AcrR family transcriptional regulator
VAVRRGQDAVGRGPSETLTRSRSSQPRPRGTRNEERWDEVLDAAAKVFAEKGYRAATLRDIAGELGMLKGSLYYYIETKEDLLFEILRRYHAGGLERYQREDQLTRDEPPAVRLAGFIRSYMASMRSLPVTLIVSETDLGELQGEGRAEVLRLRRKMFEVPLGMVAAGVENGDFDKFVDPYVATATIFRMLNSTHFWHRPARGPDWEEVTEWYVRFILQGLGSAAPSARDRVTPLRGGG